VLPSEDLVQAVDGCRILISSDYELDLIMKKTGLKKEALLERVKTIIMTMGEQGSQISTPDGGISIPAAKAKIVQDPTGAGDSYRGGLLSGLVHGKDIEESARMGSVCASFSVECHGTQEYTFSPEEFNERLNSIV
jgi:adenosine kinase